MYREFQNELMHKDRSSYRVKTRNNGNRPIEAQKAFEKIGTFNYDSPELFKNKSWPEVKEYAINYATAHIGAQSMNEFMKSDYWRSYIERLHNAWLTYNKSGKYRPSV